MSLAAQLAQGVAALGLDLPEALQARMLSYLALLQKWNRVHNLTAVREPRKMVSYHLLDSLAVLPHLEARTLVDVGSGAGFPGIPLALARPDWRVVLLDSNHKKAAFLRQATGELGLANVEVVCARANDWRPPHGFDVVISRAFAELPEFVALAAHLLAPGGVFAAMKGLYPFEEIEQLPDTCKLLRVVALQVPGLNAQRHLALLEAV
ncbi:MAG TPA: 16S rRNA (guanine(527)-N(7))-methyltransferase RsmG [Burkholderiales bacterium]|nr:16S rRNA (guanine(527)-N(7))-methyltransferase RsmG [Burkholderiales bacterium]